MRTPPILLAFPLLLAAQPAGAQPAGGSPEVVRPAGASRVVRTFDFEERRRNPTDMPLFWVRAQDDPGVPRNRPGFPLWNQARLVYGPGAASGEGAVELFTRGGSASLLLDPGVVSVFPDADYLVTAMVRTDGLERARPRLAARLLDGDGNPIPGSERLSELVRTSAGWAPVAVELPGDDARAAFVQVELLLLQPEHYERVDLPEALHVVEQDLTGSAWFDDVRIIQLPRVEIWSELAGNIVPGDDRPSFDFLVRDLTGEPLEVRLLVFDDLGRIVDERRIRSSGGVERGTWTPALPGFGWYRAIARVETGDGTIDQAFTDAVWIPAGTNASSRSRAEAQNDEDRDGTAALLASGVDLSVNPDRKRFGLALSTMPDAASDELAGAVRAAQAGFVSLPIWDATTLGATMTDRVERFAPAIDRIVTSIPSAELSLVRIPEDIRLEAGLDAGDVIGLLSTSPELAESALRPALDRFGGAVARWRLGEAGSELAFDRATLSADLDAVSAELSRLVPTPILSLPWDGSYAYRPEVVGPNRLAAVRVGSVGGVAQTDDAARRWVEAVAGVDTASQPPELRMELPGTTHGTHPPEGRRGAVESFAKTFVSAWARLTGPDAPAAPWGVTLSEAWGWTPGRRGELAPAPELAAWRVLADRLAGRAYTGEPELAVGARALLFEGTRGATLALWRVGDGPATLSARLGLEDLVAFDIYGNPEVIRLTLDKTGTVFEHTVSITNEPIFLEGVDADLIRFIAGVRLDPPLLEARVGAQTHQLIIENPWPGSIRGRLFILEPGGGLKEGDEMLRERRSWRITPRQRSFVVPGRSSQDTPIEISFSPAEESGPRDLVLDVELSAEEDYGVVRLVRPIEVGLSEAGLALSYRRGPGPGGPDLVVEAQVTNLGEVPITVELFARAPGFPRERAAIPGLQPGETATRVFPFQNAAERFTGDRVHVAAVVEETGGRLTRSVEVLLR